jgi:hypothetical protein
MKRKGEKLSSSSLGTSKFERFRELAVAALLCHVSIKAAAQSVGVGESTLRLWLGDEDFRREYDQARADVLKAAEEKLKASMLRAAQILLSLAENVKVKPTGRISACRSILDFGFRAVEFDELAEIRRGIEELEKQVGGKKS